LTKKSNSKLAALFELHCMLREMEHDVGLQDLTAMEMDVFLAAHAAHAATGKAGTAVTSDQIRGHELASNLAQATYHRALRSLVALGLLEKAQGYKTRRYVVRTDFASR